MIKLMCMACRHEMEVPLHCDVEMTYVQKGNFMKIELLRCERCGQEVQMPTHCGIPMLYVDGEYYPVYDLSEAELKEMRRVYSR